MAEANLGAMPATIEAAPAPPRAPFIEQPSSFVAGRYLVRRLLGEGGKKKVYLAHDERLDRDVAFAVIKTEGLDEVGRERILREAQAMGYALLSEFRAAWRFQSSLGRDSERDRDCASTPARRASASVSILARA